MAVKVAYLYLFANKSGSSVQNKIVQQIAALNAEGIKTEGFFFSTDNCIDLNIANVNFVEVDAANKFFFNSSRQVRLTMKAVNIWAQKEAENYQYFYIRWMGTSWSWLKFVFKYGSKIITEHQALEVREHLVMSVGNRFGLRPGKFLSWIEHRFLPWINEAILGQFVLGRLKANVSMTKQIGEYEAERAVFGKPFSFVMSNGVETGYFKTRKPPYFNERELRLLMLVGGTTDVDWHGIDLLIESIQKYQGSCKIEIHIAGDTNILEKYHSKYLVKHGYCTSEKLNELMDYCHLGLGSFAFSRKGITEGCTLKMREYAARGIPAVYGHLDVDYEPLNSTGLALRLHDSQIPDMQKIVDFARTIFSNPENGMKIREFAIRNMDYKVKISKLASFINELGFDNIEN